MIEQVLKYQTADIKLFKLEMELKSNQAFKRVAVCQKGVQDAADTLKKHEAEAVEILAGYIRLNTNLSNAEKDMKELIGAINDAGDAGDVNASECEYYLKKLDRLNEIVLNTEREITKTKRRIEDIMSSSSKLLKTIVDLTEKKKSASVEFEEVKQSRKQDINSLVSEINGLKKQLPEEVLRQYAILRNEKRLPAFVKLAGKNQCGGCGMDVPQDTLAKLKVADDYTECPNCRRYIFVSPTA